ncbi:serine protease 3-like [Teleopsis dalmanni]|uniref:serine protease 3-like n=1 Tax=Teleopsis dalmanni TaxID=139649 RepID=UPI0018CEC29C|nr:serine protease 3-like [Teleopsis dalmanni]
MKVLLVFALIALASANGYTINKDEPVLLKDLSVEDNGEINGRITNGLQASENEFPYQVGLSLKKTLSSSWCGGSLIAKNWVLTAAHCTNGVSSVTVYLGATVRTVAKITHTVSASNIHQHAGYNPTTLLNDVSLIQIPTVEETDSIQVIKLPSIASSYSTYSGSYAIASGWGRTSDSSSVATNLNYAVLPIITNTKCALTYGSSVVTSGTICVSTPSGVSTCQGDSGGPLVLESDRILVGVTSFVSSNGCASGAPAGFARVTNFLPWIKEISGIYY